MGACFWLQQCTCQPGSCQPQAELLAMRSKPWQRCQRCWPLRRWQHWPAGRSSWPAARLKAAPADTVSGCIHTSGSQTVMSNQSHPRPAGRCNAQGHILASRRADVDQAKLPSWHVVECVLDLERARLQHKASALHTCTQQDQDVHASSHLPNALLSEKLSALPCPWLVFCGAIPSALGAVNKVSAMPKPLPICAVIRAPHGAPAEAL